MALAKVILLAAALGCSGQDCSGHGVTWGAGIGPPPAGCGGGGTGGTGPWATLVAPVWLEWRPTITRCCQLVTLSAVERISLGLLRLDLPRSRTISSQLGVVQLLLSLELDV